MDLPDDELGRLARTFDEMIGRLDESFQRQRQFTADASHELRTPLTAIKGQVDVALQRDRDPVAYREVLQTLNSEVDRMIRLISSLLTLARADAGQIPLNRQATSIRTSLENAVEQIRPLAAGRGIILELREGPEVTSLSDPDLLLQLWLNLLDNAIKHTPSGGQIAVALEEDGGEAIVTVTDTGPGIAPEHLPYIFDRFYRADPARTRSEGGSGLGLSISRWIAEAHGGSIEARSQVARGSTFVVRLPSLGQ
jgi:heavy metal sensor kinase